MQHLRLAWITAALALAASEAQAAEARLRLDYDTYAAGVGVMTMSATLAIGPADYRLDMAYHTIGLASVFFGGHQASGVEGRFAGDRALPDHYAGTGLWRGTERVAVIDYISGQPVISRLQPPNETERDPVPQPLQANTIDTLSAVAELIHDVAASGRCEARATTYDGRRLASIAAHTVGSETLAPTGRSSFAGAALRCDFEGRQLGGFIHDESEDALHRVQHGTAWLAPVVGGAPPVPVRITFETRWFGSATMYLTGAASAP